jgi:hypothetical protein
MVRIINDLGSGAGTGLYDDVVVDDDVDDDDDDDDDDGDDDDDDDCNVCDNWDDDGGVEGDVHIT